MGAIFAALLIPIVVLNLLGSVSSGIWLAILGEWSPIWRGIAATIAGPFLLSICMLPSLLLVSAGAYFFEKRFVAGFWVIALVGSLYTYALMTIWCVGTLYYFLKDATPSTFVPLLIWSYGVGTGPWTFMAQKEQAAGATNAAFFAQIGYVVMMVMVIFFRVRVLDAMFAFGATMLLGICFGIAENVALARARSAYRAGLV